MNKDYLLDLMVNVRERVVDVDTAVTMIMDLETSGKAGNDSKHNVKKLLNCESCIDVGNLTGTQRCGVCKNYDKYRAI